MTLEKLNSIFFDLDDTLFDATGLAKKARIAAIESMIEKGLDIDADQGYIILKEVVSEFGSNYSKHFDMFLKRLNAHSIKLISTAVITYHRIKVQEIRLFPDVFKILQNLKEMTSCKLGIVTDGIPIKQYEKIIRLGLDSFFKIVIISDEIGIRKPNPKLFSWALSKSKSRASESMYIGDNYYNDIIPAKKIGMKTCFVHRKGKYDLELDEKQKQNVDVEVWNFKELWDTISEHVPSKR
ncbi:MAG: TIGR02253 family HAD-type hydrolase [Promethearchaeota archaeon]